MSSFIPIGILHSQSGPMAANETPLIEAALMAITEINEKGGLLGREVRPFIADGKSDDEIFAQRAWDLLQIKDMSALFGCWTSSSRKAVRPCVEHKDGLLWYPIQYEGLEQSPNIVYTGSCLNQQIAPVVEWALAQGRKRFALIGSDYVFPRTANKFVTSMLAAGESHIVHESYHPLSCRDFQSILPSLKESRPDFILNTLNGIGNVFFIEQLQEIEELSRPELVCSMSCSETLYSQLGPKAEGQLACWGYFESLDTPANRDFISRCRGFKCPICSDPIVTAYSQVLLWASIVERIGSCDPANVRANLAGSSLRCPLGTLEIQENQHVLRNAFIGRYKAQNQFDILWQSEKPIAPLPWLGVDETDLKFKDLILQVLNELPEDISMRARLESEIRERIRLAESTAKNERRLKETQAIAHVGGFERDLKTGDGYWSDMFFKMLGHEPGAFIPSLTAFEDHIVEEDRQAFHDGFLASLNEAREWHVQCRIRRADGEIRHFQIQSAALTDENGIVDRYHGTVIDITERALAEEALRESEHRMRQLAHTDELTGILSRRRFMELTRREIDRTNRYPAPFTFIMFDVDKFKNINDIHGHDVGDRVLKAIANCATGLARDVDLLGRLGGEEFGVALPQTDIHGAEVVAERLRKAVEDLEINVNGVTLKCTISLGVAELRDCATNVDSILKASDLALYRAKREGRNRVKSMLITDLEAACALPDEDH